MDSNTRLVAQMVIVRTHNNLHIRVLSLNPCNHIVHLLRINLTLAWLTNCSSKALRCYLLNLRFQSHLLELLCNELHNLVVLLCTRLTAIELLIRHKADHLLGPLIRVNPILFGILPAFLRRKHPRKQHKRKNRY